MNRRIFWLIFELFEAKRKNKQEKNTQKILSLCKLTLPSLTVLNIMNIIVLIFEKCTSHNIPHSYPIQDADEKLINNRELILLLAL